MGSIVGLATYVISRGLSMLAVFIVSVALFFVLLRVVPIVLFGGNPFEPNQLQDPVLAALRRSQEDPRFGGWIEQTAKTFGLHLPVLPHQFLIYLKNVFTFDFGISMYSMRPVAQEILIRLPYTLALYVFAVIVPIFVGYYLGILSAKYRGKFMDTFLTIASIISFILPPWLIAILVYYFLAYMPKAAWGVTIFPLPVRTPSLLEPSWESFKYWLWYLSPLYLSFVLALFGSWSYFFRQLIVSELDRDYVYTARAKGIPENLVLRKEITPNLKPPIITRLAYTIPGIFGGSIILEILASWPGVAYYSYQAFLNFDYTVITAFLVIGSMLLVISLFIADLLIAILDPRVRIGERR
ncbi:nickel transporter permease NikB [Desulfurococcaceae archaeon AG1]|nr:nickel transporter permease NikB [Desulfurococcaceae archaeon AG1]